MPHRPHPAYQQLPDTDHQYTFLRCTICGALLYAADRVAHDDFHRRVMER